MKFLKIILAFLLMAVVGIVVGWALHMGFDLMYPHGLLIDNWMIIFALLLFSAIFFFVLMMLIDLLELFCNPIRRMGGPNRVVGLAGAVALVFFLCWSLYDLWVVFYKFHFTGLGDIVWTEFVMALLMSLLTIATFSIAISCVWGPKDLSKYASS